MTPTWYNNNGRISALEAAVKSWLGTPFRENSAIRGEGGGVCCHRLPVEWYFESGFCDRFEVPNGRARSMIHGDPNWLLTQTDAALAERFAAVDLSEALLPGDLLVMRCRKIFLHFGVMVSRGQFGHVQRLQGVMYNSSADSSFSIAAVRRPRP